MRIPSQTVGLITLIITSLSVASPGACRTWFVIPDGTGDAPTIQAAVDSARPGDTVLLDDGTFTGVGNRDIVLPARNLVVRSQGGNPEHCIIDCVGRGRGFILYNLGDTYPKIEGITIQQGCDLTSSYCVGEGGGGIYSVCSALEIVDCVFSSCESSGDGGGVYLSECSHDSEGSVIVSCRFVDCYSSSAGGGAISVRQWLEHGKPVTIRETVVEDCRGFHGGGIYCIGNALISRCRVVGSRGAWGGGMLLVASDTLLQVDSTLVYGNSGRFGGGISWGNTAPEAHSARIRGCTIAGNLANIVGQDPAGGGGGLYVWGDGPGGGEVHVEHSIIAGNWIKPPDDRSFIEESDVFLEYPDDGEAEASIHFDCSAIQLSYCQGNTDNIEITPTCIGEDILFCNPVKAPWLNPTTVGDYSLVSTSPCLPENDPVACGLVGSEGLGCNMAPLIIAIRDVREDRGGKVRVSWKRAYHDREDSEHPVTGYSIWRRVDRRPTGEPPEPPGPRPVPPIQPVGRWESVGSVSASMRDTYATVCETSCDCSPRGVCWSVFLVRALTDVEGIYFESAPDSGCSVDNLGGGPPPVPGPQPPWER